MPTFLDRLKNAALVLFDIPRGQIAADHGRIAETDSLFNDPNPDTTWQNEGASYYARVAENDVIWAALDYRDVSRIWVSAAPIEREAFQHPGQLIPAEDGDQAIYDFVAWNLDERLDIPLEIILQQAQLSYLTYGFAVLEIMWQNEETPHGLRSVITNICDVDPERIILRRVYVSDGKPVSDVQQADYRMNDTTRIDVFLKKYYTNDEDLLPFPPTKIAIITNKGQFGNPYGQSELKPLIKTEFSLRQISQFWDRHLERYGSPQMVHKYSQDREGSQWDSWRKNQLSAIAKMQNQTVLQISEKGTLETLSGTGETQSFLDRTETHIAAISMVLCGSATALKEGKTGARAKEESTTVRQKSAKEQYDCSLLEACFNYQILPWLIDYNFGKQEHYPYIQMIPPQDITPTTPENQNSLLTTRTNEMDQGVGIGSKEIVEPGANVEAENEQEAKEAKNQGAQEEFTEKRTNRRVKNRISEATPKTQGAEAAALDMPVKFADEQETEKKNESLPEESKIGGFPERRAPNPLYKDKTVQEEGAKVISGLTVYTKREFDNLTDAEKKKGFTFFAMPKDKDKIAELLQIYVDSLKIPNERQAFLWVRKQIAEKDWSQTYTDRELMPSFRYARDKAYNAGIIAKAQEQGGVYALQYVTKDDPDVRWNHAKMHNIIQPIDSDFWSTWQPPNGFGCRCSVKIITDAMYERNPKKYAITPWNKEIKPDKGW